MRREGMFLLLVLACACSRGAGGGGGADLLDTGEELSAIPDVPSEHDLLDLRVGLDVVDVVDGSSPSDLDTVSLYDLDALPHHDLDAAVLSDVVKIDICTPDCGGKVCGDDGCGGSCGDCAPFEYCSAESQCLPLCGNGDCGPEEDCTLCPDDCGACCPNGMCDADETCGTCPDDCGVCYCDTALCGPLEACNENTQSCISPWTSIPAGTFWMGCNDWGDDPVDSGCYCPSYPYRHVTLGPYEIQTTEVTIGQFLPLFNHIEGGGTPNTCGAPDDPQPCIEPESEPIEFDPEEGVWTIQEGQADLPVVSSTLQGAQSYCEWIGGRLCTNEEWEKAARGGCEFYQDCRKESARYPWSTELYPPCDSHDYSYGTICPAPTNVSYYPEEIGSYPDGASRYGILDMLGNCWEWTEPSSSGSSYLRGSTKWLSTIYLSHLHPSWWWPGDGAQGIRCCRSPCGDGVCAPAQGESCLTCLEDCGPCGLETCGDGECQEDESPCTCAEDCGDPCDGFECGPAPCFSADIDCGDCSDYHTCYAGLCMVLSDCDDAALSVLNCGDGVCDAGDNCETCPEDCGPCVPCGGTPCRGWEECNTELGVCVAEAVDITADSFWMGCNEAVDSQCQENEYPQQLLTLDRYLIDRTEVTIEQYARYLDAVWPWNTHPDCCDEVLDECYACMGGYSPELSWSIGAWSAAPETARFPVFFVSWAGAQEYCQWIGRRLCTEAEWEMAARGGCSLYGDCAAEMPKYPWGNQSPDCSLAVMGRYSGQHCPLFGEPPASIETGLRPVGSRPAGQSPFGILDMTGNAFEWAAEPLSCPYGSSTLCDVIYVPDVTFRAARGGHFDNDLHRFGNMLRSSFRGAFPGGFAMGTTGFRCCSSEHD